MKRNKYRPEKIRRYFLKQIADHADQLELRLRVPLSNAASQSRSLSMTRNCLRRKLAALAHRDTAYFNDEQLIETARRLCREWPEFERRV